MNADAWAEARYGQGPRHVDPETVNADAWAEARYGQGAYRVWDGYDRAGRLVLVQAGTGLGGAYRYRCRVVSAEGQTLAELS